MLPADETTDRYLSALASWRLHREHELRALDELTRTHDDRDALNADVTTSMTLFHAIAQRHDLLLATWQDAQDGQGEREWVAQLIWGVLEPPDGDAQALALPLPDALRLSDALVASLRARVGAEDEGSPSDRMSQLEDRAARLRDDLTERGETAPADLPDRLGQIETDMAQARADGAGLPDVGTLESRLAAVDREIIVSAVTSSSSSPANCSWTN